MTLRCRLTLVYSAFAERSHTERDADTLIQFIRRSFINFNLLTLVRYSPAIVSSLSYHCRYQLYSSLAPFLPARRYSSTGNRHSNASVRLSVCLSVRHAPVLCQNEES